MKRLSAEEANNELRRVARSMRTLLEEAEKILSHVGKEFSKEEMEMVLNKTIVELISDEPRLNKRYNFVQAMKVLRIETVRDLTEASSARIMSSGMSVGQKTINIVADILASYGLSMKD